MSLLLSHVCDSPTPTLLPSGHGTSCHRALQRHPKAPAAGQRNMVAVCLDRHSHGGGLACTIVPQEGHNLVLVEVEAQLV